MPTQRLSCVPLLPAVGSLTSGVFRQDEDGGGLVSDLPSLSFPTDSPGVIPRPVTEVAVTDALERQLSDLGLIPLCDCKDTPMAVFASGQSLTTCSEVRLFVSHSQCKN